jgi:hypothetical protein
MTTTFRNSMPPLTLPWRNQRIPSLTLRCVHWTNDLVLHGNTSTSRKTRTKRWRRTLRHPAQRRFPSMKTTRQRSHARSMIPSLLLQKFLSTVAYLPLRLCRTTMMRLSPVVRSFSRTLNQLSSRYLQSKQRTLQMFVFSWSKALLLID